MDTVVVASTAQDARAVEAVKEHHAQMSGTLSTLVAGVLGAPTEAAALTARDEVVEWADTDLMPHARAEESAMYPLAHANSRGTLLVDAMLVEHVLIGSLVENLRLAENQVDAAAAAHALAVTFESHLHKENDQILPLLAADPTVSLGDALAGMHDLLGGGHGHSDPEAGNGVATSEQASNGSVSP